MVHLLYLVYRKADQSYPYLCRRSCGFLYSSFDRVGLAASTIRAYKAAILSALEPRQTFSSLQLATLNKLLNKFHKRRPPKPSPVPDWDIGLVLKAFSLPPFGRGDYL